MLYNLLVGGVSSAVRYLEEELKFYRKETEIAKGVIEQLHRGFHQPGKPVYIHPADFSVMIDELMQKDLYFTLVDINAKPSDRRIIRGVEYIVTPLMPKYTKKFDTIGN